MSALTDVEISRALNALSVTLRDQRPERFDAERAEAIVSGALAGEPKLQARATGAQRGELRRRDDGRLVATVEQREGRWVVVRELRASESTWAIPRPARDRQRAPASS